MTALGRLSPRERLLLLGAGPVALVLAAYLLAWKPLTAARQDREAEIATYRLVADAARAAAQGPEDQAAEPAADQAPLPARVTQSAEAAGLALRRLEPEGAGVVATLDDADFAAVLGWLAELESLHAVAVAAIEVDRRVEPGTVSVRATLEPM